MLASIEKLEKDTKHVSLLSEVDDEDEAALLARARELIGRLKQVGDRADILPSPSAASGTNTDYTSRR